MKLKTKIFILLAFSLLSLSLMSTIQVLAFNAGSYSQVTGTEYTWEILNADSDPLNLGANVNDRFRVVITVTNQSSIYNYSKLVGADCLWGTMYKNSAANRTWTLFYPSITLLAAYNATIGILNVTGPPNLFANLNNQTTLNIVPTTTSAINKTYFAAFQKMGLIPGSYKFKTTSGCPMITINTSTTRWVFLYNSKGVLKDVQVQNGTSAHWIQATTQFRASLLEAGPATGFDLSIWPVLLTGPIFIALAFLYVYFTEWRKKTKVN